MKNGCGSAFFGETMKIMSGPLKRILQQRQAIRGLSYLLELVLDEL